MHTQQALFDSPVGSRPLTRFKTHPRDHRRGAPLLRCRPQPDHPALTASLYRSLLEDVEAWRIARAGWIEHLAATGSS